MARNKPGQPENKKC